MTQKPRNTKRLKQVKKRETAKKVEAKKVAEAQKKARTQPLPKDPANNPMFAEPSAEVANDITAILCMSGWSIKPRLGPDGWRFDATWSSQETPWAKGVYASSRKEAAMRAAELMLLGGAERNALPEHKEELGIPMLRLTAVLNSVCETGGVSAMAFYDQSYKDGDRWFTALHLQSDPDAPYPNREALITEIIDTYKQLFGDLSAAYGNVEEFDEKQKIIADSMKNSTTQVDSTPNGS